MDMMNKSLDGIKKFSIRVAGTLVKFSHKGVRVKPRYKLMFINEGHFSTVWSYSGGRTRFIVAAVAAWFLCTIAGAALLGMTPLRTLLPGYLKSAQRDEMIDVTTRVDSLKRIAEVNNLYLSNMVAILNDDIDLDSVQRAYNDSIKRQQLPVDSLLGTSEAEREFVRQHEQRERFNVSVLSPVAAEGMSFYPPVGITLVTATEPSGRMMFQLNPSSPVSSIYRGTVVDSYYQPDNGYTMVVQHPNEFISRYSGIEIPMVKRGDKVNAGTRLGLSSTGSATERLPVTFEMWHKGSQLDPKNYLEPV